MRSSNPSPGLSSLFVLNMKMRPIRISMVAALLISASACSKQERGVTQVDVPVEQEKVVIRTPLNYPQAIAGIAAERRLLSEAYLRAKDSPERQRALSATRTLFVFSIAETMFPYWYGTPWDFNGTTRTPGEGQIACGYFVSTVLLDAGLQVERVRMAQQASELIIKSLTSEKYIRRFRHVPIEEFVASVQEWGPGLYVVGLDQHTGFVLHENSKVFFIHSSYLNGRVVVKEPALESSSLSQSKYRVLGKISEDDALLIKWLQGSRFPTQTR